MQWTVSDSLFACLLIQTEDLPDLLVQSWMQPCTWCPVPNLLPVQSRVAAKAEPSYFSQQKLRWRPRSQKAASLAMEKGGLRPLLSGVWCRFSSAAFSWVASDIHSGVQEQNKVHKAAGSRGRTIFLVVSQGQYRAWGNAYSTTLHCCPEKPLPWRRKGKEFQSWEVFSANPLGSARALLDSPLIFMLISFYNFYD